jgi:predicted Mrr-cat superfamily restriction endonuclease
MTQMLYDRVREIRAHMAEKQKELEEVMAQIAQTKTEFKVGDLVYVPGCGEDKYQISRIESHIGDKDFQPKFFGRKLRKDGTPGKEFELWRADCLSGLKYV